MNDPSETAARLKAETIGLNDRAAVARFKGILILAIVVGHNRLLTGNIPNLFKLLYFWHVIGFFFIAFARKGFNIRTPRTIVDLSVRYMTPFIILGSALAAGRVIVSGDLSIVTYWIAAIYSGSAYFSEAATSLSLLWFLPTLLGLYMTMWLGSAILARLPRFGWPILSAILIVGFVVSVQLPPEIMRFVPLNLGLAMYILPLCVVFSLSLDALDGGRRTRLPLLALALALVAVTIFTLFGENTVNISVYRFAMPESPLLLILNALASVAMAALVFVIARHYVKMKIFETLGNLSLYIYLFHEFFQFAIFKVLVARIASLPLAVVILIGLAASAISILLAISVSLLLNRMPAVKRLVFPKDLDSLRKSFAHRREPADSATDIRAIPADERGNPGGKLRDGREA